MSAGKLIPALLEETKDPDSALISAWREVPAVKLLSRQRCRSLGWRSADQSSKLVGLR